MLYHGTRNTTTGNGTAIVTAGATQRLRVNGFLKIQAKESGTINALLQFVKSGSSDVTIYSVYMDADVRGEIIDKLPLHVSEPGASLHIDIDVAKIIAYAIEVDVIERA
jgi:hypothetical protein